VRKVEVDGEQYELPLIRPPMNYEQSLMRPPMNYEQSQQAAVLNRLESLDIILNGLYDLLTEIKDCLETRATASQVNSPKPSSVAIPAKAKRK